MCAENGGRGLSKNAGVGLVRKCRNTPGCAGFDRYGHAVAAGGIIRRPFRVKISEPSGAYCIGGKAQQGLAVERITHQVPVARNSANASGVSISRSTLSSA